MIDYVVPPACGSPTPTASASAPTSPRARRSCTRGSSTTTPARSAPRWSRAGSARASSSATARDIGGSASIMGTLSGGGTEVISIGERCLLGANAGLGISLGDDCVVEAGLYVTGGTAGHAARRRGRQGARAVRRRRPAVPPQLARPARSRCCRSTGSWGGLNAALHANYEAGSSRSAARSQSRSSGGTSASRTKPSPACAEERAGATTTPRREQRGGERLVARRAATGRTSRRRRRCSKPSALAARAAATSRLAR